MKSQHKQKILAHIGQHFTYLSDAIQLFWGYKGSKFKRFPSANKYVSGLLKEMVQEGVLILNLNNGYQDQYTKNNNWNAPTL